MRRIYLFIYIAAALVLGACRNEQTSDSTVFVSIAPIKPLVEAVVGNDFEVEVLVPAGASPELFEPTPRQVARLSRAPWIFGTGLLSFEQSLLGKLEQQAQIVNLSRGIELIGGSCACGHAHHDHAHHGVDPHIWCSPKALYRMAENIYEAIHTTLPDSTKYETRYTALCQQILDLDEEVSEMCRYAPHGYFVIFHPALSYLARDYGLEQVALENDGKEASVKRIAEVIDRARRDGIKRVFYQSEFPRHSVEAVCRDIGAEPIEIDPLNEDIFNNLRHITRLITE